MKNLVTLIFIILFLFSCQKKENIEVSMPKKEPIKKDTLKLLFSNCIDDGRFHNTFSFISYSDSIFFISRSLGDSELYLNGKLILKKNILDYNEYDSITKKYHLIKMDILKFSRPSLNYQFKENSACTKLKSNNSKILFHSVMKSKSGSIFQYIVYENKVPILKICNTKKSYIFNIKNMEFDKQYNNEDIRSYIKLIDITGDGKEELFIFYNVASFPALCFDVFKINYIE
jgi:hypothetical protein